MRWLFALLLVLAAPLAADPVPALFDVTGVAADDVLNVRAEPLASSGVIGTLAPDAVGVEVVELTFGADWGRVNVNEMSGWVSMRYMQRQPDAAEVWMTPRFVCSGTEPFWSLTVEQGVGAQFQILGEAEQALPAGLLKPGAGVNDRYALTLGQNVAILRQMQCHDGMSDRAYGLDVGLMLNGSLFADCCTLLAD
ncbi:SH3 domain-containing protein [Ruegeria pomeroyi]|uniref:SH3 domain-containing protein n=1 Tax=Ruegeria pomeroyi TaxID=89184 RepID=UPI001F2FFE35|nr:SH3 domain-containing protein [Ruegeria pomeroyi]MCE8507343.1 SH3 domain-containing protein [Ruegeria pomeroyi]